MDNIGKKVGTHNTGTIQKHILKTQQKSVKNVESEIKKLDLENFIRSLSISRLYL